MNPDKKEKANSTLEVLAPAKNYKYAKEAIKCGADAVYMGAESFGLRYGFGNNLKEIAKTVKFAHKYWAKVFVTVNTLIFKDEDFKEVKNLIDNLYKLGVDAIIIQDFGLLELDDLPPIPMHASTTTSCFDAKKIDFLENVGIKRVILPRELSLEQIKEIKEKTNADLEAFVHGLLCVGYSGKCYMNFSKNLKTTKCANSIDYYQKYGASNGKCNMNCMHSYSLLDADGNTLIENERLLNLPFLNLSTQLEDIVDAGVTSFKIEGRHKELSYIKNIVSIFREKTDKIIAHTNHKKASSGIVIKTFEPGLEKTFNKGYTDFFLHGRKKEMYGNNKMVGEFVGNTFDVKNNSFKLDSNTQLNKGDKLRFTDEKGTLQKIDIVKVNKNTFYFVGTQDLKEKMPIYRYLNQRAVKEIEQGEVHRVIPVSLNINKFKDYICITAEDEDKNIIKINLNVNDFTLLSSNDKIISNDEMGEILKKLTNSEFLINQIKADDELKLSKESVKKLKSLIFSNLRKERKKNRPIQHMRIKKNNYPYPDKELTYLDNIVNSKAEAFFRRHGVEKIEPGYESSFDLSGKNALTGKYCIKYELDMCPKINQNVKIKEPLFLKDDKNNTFELKFNCLKCEMNVIF